MSYNNFKIKICAKGFTLVELLLYVGISSVILFVISMFLGAMLQSQVKNQAILEVEQQGMYVLSLMTRTVRNSEAITNPTTGLSDSSLSLSMPTPLVNPSLFSVSSGVLFVTEGIGSPVALTNNRVTVSDFIIENLSRASTSGTVKIQFKISYKNPSGRNEYDFSKTFYGNATINK